MTREDLFEGDIYSFCLLCYHVLTRGRYAPSTAPNALNLASYGDIASKDLDKVKNFFTGYPESKNNINRKLNELKAKIEELEEQKNQFLERYEAKSSDHPDEYTAELERQKKEIYLERYEKRYREALQAKKEHKQEKEK